MFSSVYANTVHRYNEVQLSDRNVKTNITPIVDPTSLIMRLQGVKFDFTEEAFPNTSDEIRDILVANGKGKYGFIAQDVMEVLPKSVIYDDELQLHLLSTDAIIPLLVESTKIQQVIIDSLKTELDNIKNRLANSPLLNENTNSSEAIPRTMGSEKQVAKLYQNYPNPFRESTIIRYNLSASTSSATLNIYNINGKQLKSINLTQKGEGSVTIRKRTLKAGIYLYSIIADGEVIDTKQFILTK